MSKFHKKNKAKKRTRRSPKIGEGAKNKIGEAILQSKNFEGEIEILETPFGEILINDQMLLTTLKNKAIIFELLKIGEEIEESDVLSRLIYLEKLKDKYPNEPFLAHEISICYEDMKEWDKYDKAVKENYEKHRGYPSIDISYVSLNFDEYDTDLLDDIFGQAMNIHQVYPIFKAFDSKIVAAFYATLSTIYKNRNELLRARQCAEIVTQFNKLKGGILETRIDLIEKPWFRWKSRLIIGGIILLILSVIGGIIWGIISLFQWVF